MKRICVVLLLIVLCCSACSFQSEQVSSSSVEESSSSSSSQSANDESSSLPPQENSSDEPDASSSDSVDEISSPPAPVATPVESDVSSTTPDYQGLTQEQWQTLQDQKELYGDLSDKELEEAVFNGKIECRNFIHFFWEDSIAINFVDYVGNEEFEHWVRERERAGQCVDIYSFAEHFSISQEELLSLIEENHLAQIYDLETVKNRYAYFIELQNDNAE